VFYDLLIAIQNVTVLDIVILSVVMLIFILLIIILIKKTWPWRDFEFLAVFSPKSAQAPTLAVLVIFFIVSASHSAS
jgi:hypothetical protein